MKGHFTAGYEDRLDDAQLYMGDIDEYGLSQGQGKLFSHYGLKVEDWEIPYAFKGSNAVVRPLSATEYAWWVESTEGYFHTMRLLYEGGFHAGQKSGTGTEYDEEGHLIYTGEFHNGQRQGKGKLYDRSGKLLFDGTFSSGQPLKK